MEYNYRGLKITSNINHEHGTPYYTILKEDKKNNKCAHAHATSLKMAEKIVDCYVNIQRYGNGAKYTRWIRNNALRLMEFKVKY